jgi:hypothetical protein
MLLFLCAGWECLKQWAHEIHNMGCIAWETLLVELSAVEAEDKQAESTFEGIRATRETTRFASQTCQIVTEFGIVSFHRIGVGLAF